MKHESGLVLPSTLVILGLTSTTLALATVAFLSLQRTTNDYQLSRKLLENLAESEIETNPVAQEINTVRVTHKRNGFYLVRELFVLRHNNHNKIPLIDFNSLFDNVSTCAPQEGKTFLNGINAVNSCTPPSSLRESFTTDMNLYSKQLLIDGSAGALRVSVGGNLRIEGELTIKGNVDLISSGSVLIDRIYSGSTAQINILSATGSVIVKERAGPLTITTIAPLGFSIPGELLPFKLFIPISERSMIIGRSSPLWRPNNS